MNWPTWADLVVDGVLEDHRDRRIRGHHDLQVGHRYRRLCGDSGRGRRRRPRPRCVRIRFAGPRIAVEPPVPPALLGFGQNPEAASATIKTEGMTAFMMHLPFVRRASAASSRLDEWPYRARLLTLGHSSPAPIRWPRRCAGVVLHGCASSPSTMTRARGSVPE